LSHHDQPVSRKARADFLLPGAIVAEYTKQWKSIEQQVLHLKDHGVQIPDDPECKRMLASIGYYRLSGYLYPFRSSEAYSDEKGRERIRVLSGYRAGTRIQDAFALVEFDRNLRMLVLEATERIEIALRMRLGYVIGEASAFAHENADTFLPAFSDKGSYPDVPASTLHVARSLFPSSFRSKHEMWLERVSERQRGASDESFVAHFTKKYDNRLPVWALTEILEMGHLSRLYGGLNPHFAMQVADAFHVPTKKIMVSWFASLNYTRNVSAHHARLYNRKLQAAPARPKIGMVPSLDHLTSDEMPKAFGVYNVLAVMAYLLSTIDPGSSWPARVVQLADSFPSIQGMDIGVVGFPVTWRSQSLWHVTEAPGS
jgi:abortive infection bacteriophage resistance protein